MFEGVTEYDGVKYYYNQGVLHSVYPPETMFGYTYWSQMIPPFKPKTVLILGYGLGTISKLIKKIWGDDIEVTGVDINEVLRVKEDNFLRQDARVYVDTTDQKFDYVVIDLFIGDKVPDFVFEDEFLSRLAMRTNKMVAINMPVRQSNADRLYRYFHVDQQRPLEGNTIWFLIPYHKYVQAISQN